MLKGLSVYAKKLLNNKSRLNKAIDRYKRWMYLQAIYSDQALQPSKDVLILWHVHMLHPLSYNHDLTKLAEACECDPRELDFITSPNRIRPHLFRYKAIESCEPDELEALWKDVFETNKNNSVNDFGIQQVSIDLERALENQIPFFQKITSLGNMDASDIEKAILRYEKFLGLALSDKVSPTIDIDIIWHTHQRMHWQYVRFFGERGLAIVDHDDDMHREDQWKTDYLTKELWFKNYQEDYENLNNPWQTFSGKSFESRKSGNRTNYFARKKRAHQNRGYHHEHIYDDDDCSDDTGKRALFGGVFTGLGDVCTNIRQSCSKFGQVCSDFVGELGSGDGGGGCGGGGD